MARALLISDSAQIEFSSVESENPTRTNQVTDNPVEQGVNIADHVKPEAISFQISGEITGEDAGQQYDLLDSFWKNANLLTYSGRNIIPYVVIENLSSTHDSSIANGFKFSMTLKQIRIATLQFVDLSNVPIPARPKKNKGKQGKKSKQSKKKKVKGEIPSYLNNYLNNVSTTKTGG